MSRPFFTVPGEKWRRDGGLNGCREDSIAVFKVIAEASDRNWRLEVSPGNHAFSVRLCFLDRERSRRWSEERISRALDELRARGCLLLATSGDREWLEIPDRLAYCKGHKREDPLKGPDQGKLAMGGDLFALPGPRTGMRGESESEERRAKAESDGRGVAVEWKGGDSGTRARSRSGDSGGRFKRDEGAFPGDPAWGEFCLLLAGDMVVCGALWVTRWTRDRDACITGMRDWKALQPQERAKGTPAAWITMAFENAQTRKRRAS